VTLSNGARRLTTLHVARLRVDILGNRSTLAGGHCQGGDYFGGPLSGITPGTSAGAPTSANTGGVALSDQTCPLKGDATGLPSADISQTDDISGGLTITEVPQVLDTSPLDGETVYGAFRALAESGLVLPGNAVVPTDPFTRISLRIVTASRGVSVFKAANVDTAQGVGVPALSPGNYIGIWTLTDANGDRRLVVTRFIARLGRTGPAPKINLSCRHSGTRIRCSVVFPRQRTIHGQLKIRLTRGGSVVALGHGAVRRGRAGVELRVVGTVNGGPWRATIVLKQPHLLAVTAHRSLRTVP
jgi:hypothetical protein